MRSANSSPLQMGKLVMTDPRRGGNLAPTNIIFGRRKVVPRACVADGKKHLRAFLTEIFEDLGFVTSECAKAHDMEERLATLLPDLVVIGVSAEGIDAGKIFEILVRREFDGKVLAIGARESIVMKAMQQVGEEYGLAMLPPL